MLPIKRLYSYILSTFLPVFTMTFVICLFVVLMQFLWKYVEDLVGKGLDTLVLAELFLYAALNLIPMALPLAILLASLMAFGSMGENFELTAIKASGVSLLKAMRPLIIFIVLLSIGAFFFQNDAVPRINIKFRTLFISVKQKSPELDIPEGSFYNEIDNYSLFVKKKDKKTNTLRDVMIYDTSKGFDNMAVIVCDSAKMKMSSSKDYLLLNLFNGQQFANFKQGVTGTTSKYTPYSRENFREKEIVISFDANFKRMDESTMEGSQVSKNIKQLDSTIDSLNLVVDSMNITDRKALKFTYLSYKNRDKEYYDQDEERNINDRDIPRSINVDSLLATYDPETKVSIYNTSISQVESARNDYMFRSMMKSASQKSIRQHKVEWHRKFTLSFACLIFFFIGAPLGAIIRKGGLGMPTVISIVLFIVYYIIDNVGYKMARDGVWEVWQGVWLSSFILFPLGAFLTYKAMNDSALLNVDAYQNFIKKIFRKKKNKK